MKLNECEKGDTYYVKSIQVAEAIGRRLEALGVNEKTSVTILNKKRSGSVIIKVRGTRLALGRRIAEGIEVEDVREMAGARRLMPETGKIRAEWSAARIKPGIGRGRPVHVRGREGSEGRG